MEELRGDSRIVGDGEREATGLANVQVQHMSN